MLNAVIAVSGIDFGTLLLLTPPFLFLHDQFIGTAQPSLNLCMHNLYPKGACTICQSAALQTNLSLHTDWGTAHAGGDGTHLNINSSLLKMYINSAVHDTCVMGAADSDHNQS